MRINEGIPFTRGLTKRAHQINTESLGSPGGHGAAARD